MKTRIIREDCIACGNAYCIIDENNMTEVVPDKYRSLVLEAQVNCPTEAVYVEED